MPKLNWINGNCVDFGNWRFTINLQQFSDEVRLQTERLISVNFLQNLGESSMAGIMKDKAV